MSDPEAFLAEMKEAGHPTSVWSNPPGDEYGWHSHSYRKILCCLSGSIVFHAEDGDHALAAGDRLVLPAGTSHAASVGPDGVRCAEAHVA